MKKLVFLSLAFLATEFVTAQKIQENDVPASVKTAFQQKYPNAIKTKWEKEKDNFEASFKTNDSKYKRSVLIDKAGSIVETEEEISIEALPSNVKKYVSTNCKNCKIKGAAKITDSKNNITYEAEVKGKDLIFDSAGNFIKEVKD